MTQKEEKITTRAQFKWTEKPEQFVVDVFPNETITLRFQKHGKLYFREMELIVK